MSSPSSSRINEPLSPGIICSAPPLTVYLISLTPLSSVAVRVTLTSLTYQPFSPSGSDGSRV